MKNTSSLTVLYDAKCPFCAWCRTWLEKQTAVIPVSFVDINQMNGSHPYAKIPWIGEHIVVIDNNSQTWAGSAAMIMCLWSLRNWKNLSYTLSNPLFLHCSNRFFTWVSKNRHTLATLMGLDHCIENHCMVSQPPKVNEFP